MRWLRRLGWTALALIVLVCAAGLVYSRLALPVSTGELRLSGAQGSIRIARDVHGIPSIEAQSVTDLAFGLGVAHAQDRLWQLETHRRIGSGQLAEAFGEAAVANDRFLRALGVRRAAERQWARLQADGSPQAVEARAVLLAYAQGVNSWVREGLRARPPEFLVLGLQPVEWTPVDSLAWSIMMAWDLGGNWTSELLRLRLSERLPVARIHELMPPYPGEPVPETADFAALYRQLQLLPAASAGAASERWWALGDVAPPSGIEGVGSNNWVLAGSHSTTGRPLLANDPHLKLSAPALWYLARLKAPGLEVAGASMPGLPMVVLGQNRHIAWGFTNTGPDVQDLYIEQVKPDDPTHYRTPQGWAAFEQAEDTIRVRGGAEVRITVRHTRHGPVISDAYDAAQRLGPGGGAPERHVLALRWTALDADAETLSVGLALNRADSVEAFIQAAKAGWRAPMQNMVVADNRGAGGHIAVVLPGRIPVRKPGNDLKGLAPAPGWDERYDWAGWLPPEALFTERDPSRGWIATANQRTVPPDWPHFLSSDWALPYRQQRIEALLQARPRHSLDDLRTLQADIRSLAVDSLLPYLQRARSAHPLAAAAQAQLQGFDGVMAADRAAPLIYWAWYRNLVRALVADEIGPGFDQRAGNRTFRDAVEAMLAAGEPGAADNARAWWCDDKGTPATPETCQARVDLAFTLALEELHQRFGSDVAAWRWGDAHQARSEHRPFSSVKPLARFFELRTPVGGDTYTVNVSRVGLSADRTTGERYLDEHGPSLRALYDVATLENSRIMHSTGQSGLPWARHYRSFVKPWAAVQDVPLWGRGEEGGVLVVQPAAAPR